MKKLMLALLIIVLTIGCGCAYMADDITFTTPYFTLTLPGDWEIEPGSEYKSEYFEAEDLGFFYSPDDIGLAIEAWMYYFEDIKDFSLWNADEEQLQAYADETMELFEDEDAEYLGIVMADRIPFVLIRSVDEDGEYLYAETVTNGYTITFYGYVMDYNDNTYPFTVDHIEQFKQILSTLRPIA